MVFQNGEMCAWYEDPKHGVTVILRDSSKASLREIILSLSISGVLKLEKFSFCISKEVIEDKDIVDALLAE